jgi:hypothetical protein
MRLATYLSYPCNRAMLEFGLPSLLLPDKTQDQADLPALMRYKTLSYCYPLVIISKLIALMR